MTSLTDVFVTVRPDLDKFGPEVKKKLAKIDTKADGAKVAGRFGVGFNGAFGGIVKHSAGLFVGAFAAIKGAQVFGSFINDARESAKVSRLSAAVIKSTGGVAKITAAQIGDLATAISNKTGADDEAIQSGENLLATFTNIRNESGKGNDIFNRATQSAVDLAAAMNNGVVDAAGLKTANIQLGKALNDPIKGTTALGKAGVSFSADQKKQIKTMQESGNILGAQKIILGEVGKEFGGAAAAAADPLTRLTTIGGNLAEKIGGFLLPAVGKFASFVGDTAIPAISELFDLFKTGDFTSAFADAFNVSEDSKFVDFLFTIRETAISVFTEVTGGFRAFAASWKANDGDVTSSGFPGFMERVGYFARQAFEFFKTDVLPRLKEFAGYVTGTVIPALVTFGTNLTDTLGPAVKDVFGFFKDEVLPRLKDFGGFVKDEVLPKLVDLADSLSKNKDFLVPFAATIVTVVSALKAWAIVQGILNLVLISNPIGLVVVAIAALVGGLVWAYKNSETFRLVVDSAFKGASAAVSGMWNLVKPILGFFWDYLKWGWGQLQLFAKVAKQVWDSVKEPARAAFAFVVDKFLDLVGALLDGAVKAFGWVPGIGDKLKGAQAAFKTFKTSVNASLAGINDQVVKITPVVLAAQKSRQAKNQTDRRLAGQYLAKGGSVFGPGTGTSDDVPAMLSNGEHVWTAKEVKKAGGHGAVEQMRSEVMKYAKGGRVGLDVKGDFPYIPKAAANIAATAVAVARPIAQALGNAISQISPGLAGVLSFVKSQVGKPYSWGGVGPGGYDCSGLISAAINVARGKSPYRRLGATGSMPWPGFTSGPGAFEVGWFKGNPGHTAATVNGVNIESAGGVGVRMGRSARGARSSLFTNRAHVKGFADGGPVTKSMARDMGIPIFDRGGPWKSGTLAANTSGKTETVVPGGGVLELGPKTINAIADAVAARPTMLNDRRIDEAFTATARRRY